MFEIDRVRCIHHTTAPDGSIKALRVTGAFFGPEPVWIPNWAVSDDSPVWKKGTQGKLIVDSGFADGKGWI